MEQLKNEILGKLYAAYGTDSGILFGIKDRKVVDVIVEFVLNHVSESEDTPGYAAIKDPTIDDFF